jgi:hypothetical protein
LAVLGGNAAEDSLSKLTGEEDGKMDMIRSVKECSERVLSEIARSEEGKDLQPARAFCGEQSDCLPVDRLARV